MKTRRKQALQDANDLRTKLNGYKKATRRDFVFLVVGTLLIVGFINTSMIATNTHIPPTLEAQASNALPPVEVAENWNEFIQSAKKIAAIYNYPLKLLLAQAAHESNRGLSEYARVRNNYFGMGCFDWNPDGNCFWYENQEQGIVDYIINIRSMFPQAWEVRDNPEAMLNYLIYNEQGYRYATDPDYVQKVMNTPEWREY